MKKKAKDNTGMNKKNDTGWKQLLAGIIIFTLIFSCIVLAGYKEIYKTSEIKTEAESIKSSSNKTDAPFEVRMLDVGQGLSVLIKSDGHYLVYDGGGRDKSSYVVSNLKKHKVNSLDYMIVSHYDEDHISGLIGILNTTKVKQVLTPDYSADTDIYKSFRTKLEKSGAKETHPKVHETYQLGAATIEILGPTAYNYENENNRSIVIKVSYGSFSCMITGDAEIEAEEDMVDTEKNLLDVDLYVVGHHGSSSSSSAAFVDAMTPSYAFISAGKDNAYGHPAESTIKTLKKHDCSIYRMDEQGEVIAFTDGKSVWFNVKESKPPSTEVNEEPKTYILNTNTMKFHLPECDSVQMMKEKNKKESTAGRQELIDLGYAPCGSCKP